jgi:hypothetical protein
VRERKAKAGSPAVFEGPLRKQGPGHATVPWRWITCALLKGRRPPTLSAIHPCRRASAPRDDSSATTSRPSPRP